MRSSIFINQPTVIDHAYIDNEGRVVGGSFNPNFTVTGEVEAQEKVVVDFSTLKKSLKAVIDSHDNGYDHKLWILDKWSKFSVRSNAVGRINIVTPFVNLDIPLDAVKFLYIAQDYSLEECGLDMANFLTTEVSRLYPEANIRVDVVNQCEPQMFPSQIVKVSSYSIESAAATFRYQHGLRDSTSWGCQSLAHGHLSFLQVFYRTWDRETLANEAERASPYALVKALMAKIAFYLDGATFINSENLVAAHNPDNVAIEYETDRGYFRAEYSPESKLIVLDTETTVEYLVQHLVEKFAEELTAIEAMSVYFSEGLSKGAVVDL